MNNTWKTALLQAAALTFEELCFLFPEAELDAEELSPVDVAVGVDFHGPFHGTLEVSLWRRRLPSVAANILGEDDSPTQ